MGCLKLLFFSSNLWKPHTDFTIYEILLEYQMVTWFSRLKEVRRNKNIPRINFRWNHFNGCCLRCAFRAVFFSHFVSRTELNRNEMRIFMTSFGTGENQIQNGNNLKISQSIHTHTHYMCSRPFLTWKFFTILKYDRSENKHSKHNGFPILTCFSVKSIFISYSMDNMACINEFLRKKRETVSVA